MNRFNAEDVADELPKNENSTETVRTEAISVELMRFTGGDEDTMHAHSENEVYQVVSGTGKLNVDGESTNVNPGDVIHLEPGTEHRFHDVEGELVLTVFYAPAKHSAEA